MNQKELQDLTPALLRRCESSEGGKGIPVIVIPAGVGEAVGESQAHHPSGERDVVLKPKDFLVKCISSYQPFMHEE